MSDPEKHFLLPTEFEQIKRAVLGYADEGAVWHDGLLQKMDDSRLLQRLTLGVAAAALFRLEWPDIAKFFVSAVAQAAGLQK
jgi:hypothetical protein